ncbi:MAG TPA: hypothetical protein VNM48_01390 [Chloroflexota bacterium]|nr:hypothetical protein [Chloroflexota bacterium]
MSDQAPGRLAVIGVRITDTGIENWHTQHAQALASENWRLRADVVELKGTVMRLIEEVERLRELARATA